MIDIWQTGRHGRRARSILVALFQHSTSYGGSQLNQLVKGVTDDVAGVLVASVIGHYSSLPATLKVRAAGDMLSVAVTSSSPMKSLSHAI